MKSSIPFWFETFYFQCLNWICVILNWTLFVFSIFLKKSVYTCRKWCAITYNKYSFLVSHFTFKEKKISSFTINLMRTLLYRTHFYLFLLCFRKKSKFEIKQVDDFSFFQVLHSFLGFNRLIQNLFHYTRGSTYAWL